MGRMLIIGKSSYIGSSFQKYMKEHAKDEISIDACSAADGAWKEIDFCNYDTVLHAAAIVHKREEPDMQEDYHNINTVFPLEVAKKAKKSGVKKFVFLSTMAVYGNEVPLITQKTIKNPVTLYGKSKLEAEIKLEQLAEVKFKVVILRPPMVYGKGCPGNYGKLENLSRILPVFPNVGNQRSMIYIENLCECIKQVTGEASQKDCIFVCPQNLEYVNTSNLVFTIRKFMGKKTFLLPFGGGMITIMAKKNLMLQKVFGDCCYEKNISDNQYQVVGFEDSIRRTVTGEKR